MLSGRSRRPAFTLIELLVVISIMGLLMGLAVPAFRTLGGSNIISTASRQLADDLNQARLRAINGRTTVYVVFFPKVSQAFNPSTIPPRSLAIDLPVNRQAFVNRGVGNNLIGGQLISYAMFTRHSLGEQPGRSRPKYLVNWKKLPDGVFLDPNAITNANTFLNYPVDGPNGVLPFPCPDATNSSYILPYIAFDPQGRVVGRQTDVKIPLLRGSISYFRAANGTFNIQDASTIERPVTPATNVLAGVSYYVVSTNLAMVRYNGTDYRDGDNFVGVVNVPNVTVNPGAQLRVLEGVSLNWLTGRARVVRPEIP